MKNIKLNYKDDLGDVDVYWFDAIIDKEEYISIAKDMDSEDYNNSCFSIILTHHKDENKYICDLSYVTNMGNIEHIVDINDENIIEKLKQLII